MDGDILVVYGWRHFGCIWMETFWLYMDGVILVVYGSSHFGCTMDGVNLIIYG